MRSTHLTGRVGFFKRLPGGRAELVVRNFFNDPSSEYLEEPAAKPGCRGLSVHVYNDGGVFGGFGELECNGRTIGGAAGRKGRTISALVLYGEEEKILAIAGVLLGAGGVVRSESSLFTSPTAA